MAEFKRSLFDMYKSHLEMISALPEEGDNFPAAPPEEELPHPPAPAVQENADAFEARFGDLASEQVDLNK